ncbi:MAG TPA: glyoxylate/hydroxypyruvate reductase A [Burkholderiales bacterium]|nr:glyoxylate/hydroxypyruvate reductase A [Burkholderiales bacterium]
MPLNILFASEIEDAGVWLPRLRQALPHDRFYTNPEPSTDVALIATPPKGTFEPLKRLKLVQSLWMGVERLLADPAFPKGVPLARLVDPGMVAAMSETVLAHVLDWHRHHYYYRIEQDQRRWNRLKQYLASDRTIGLLGLGELGSDAARKLAALGFNVVGWSRRPKQLAGVTCLTDLDAVLERSDVVVCLLPLTAHTRGILNFKTLRKIKLGGAVINVARGGHLVAEDLIAVLDSGHLAHAYLDVFEHEPLPHDHPLWKHPGITVTPHAAALTEPRTAIPRIVENVERLRRGEPPLNLVDFDAGY